MSQRYIEQVSDFVDAAIALDLGNPCFMIAEHEAMLKQSAIKLGTADYYRAWPLKRSITYSFGSGNPLNIPFDSVINRLPEANRKDAYYLGVMRINVPSYTSNMINTTAYDNMLLGNYGYVSSVGTNKRYWNATSILATETANSLSTGVPQFTVDRVLEQVTVMLPIGAGSLTIDHGLGFTSYAYVEPAKIDFLCKFIEYRFVEAIIQARSGITLDADFTISTDALRARLETLKAEVDYLKATCAASMVQWS